MAKVTFHVTYPYTYCTYVYVLPLTFQWRCSTIQQIVINTTILTEEFKCETKCSSHFNALRCVRALRHADYFCKQKDGAQWIQVYSNRSLPVQIICESSSIFHGQGLATTSKGRPQHIMWTVDWRVSRNGFPWQSSYIQSLHLWVQRNGCSVVKDDANGWVVVVARRTILAWLKCAKWKAAGGGIRVWWCLQVIKRKNS